MKTLQEMRAAAEAVAEAGGRSRVEEPWGTYNGGLFFHAGQADGEGGCTGLPLAYWVDMETGEARLCSVDESDLLTERWFLSSLGPVPE